MKWHPLPYRSATYQGFFLFPMQNRSPSLRTQSRMPKGGYLFQRILLLGAVCTLLLIVSCSEAAPGSPVVFQENFDEGVLDLSRWEITIDGDFSEAVVDVVDVDQSDATDHRLRLQANTLGTSDPLKYVGIRSKNPIDFTSGKDILFDLDWNNQANGCYLTASFYLCPVVSNNPRAEDNWLKFEYAGVPPGRNVRINIWEKVEGIVNPLFTDQGAQDDQGRPRGMPLGNASHTIGILLDTDSLHVMQDDAGLLPLSQHNLNFTTGYMYLQMSSGTNYPSREVYFDNIVVQSASSSGPAPAQ